MAGMWDVDDFIASCLGKSDELPELYEPPLVRFGCRGCDNRWDAWVNDDGKLQDPRDLRCSCGKPDVYLQTDE